MQLASCRSASGRSTRSGRPGQGHECREAPGGPRGLPHVPRAGPDPGPDLHADGRLDRGRPAPRYARPATCTSWRPRTARTVFAKTYAEHLANIKKYGYDERARRALPRGRRTSPRPRRARIALAGTTPTGPPGRPDSPGCAPGWRRAGSTPTSGVRPENSRYLTGLRPGRRRGEGRRHLRLVPRRSAPRSSCSPTSRYTIQAGREAPDARDRAGLRRPGGALAETLRSASGAVPAGSRSRRASSAATGSTLGSGWPPRAPAVELVAGRGLGRGGSRGEGTGRGRTGRGCLRRGGPGPRDACCRRSGRGSRETELALRLEWLIRTGGADASPSTSPASPGPRRRCRTARPAIGRFGPGRCCCSTSGRRWPAIAAT